MNSLRVGQSSGGTVVFQADGWNELNRRSEEELNIPAGALADIEVRGPGLGVLGDLAGVEAIWREAMLPNSIQVLDVEGTGFNTMIVHVQGRSTVGQASMGIGFLVAVLIGALLVLGLQFAIDQLIVRVFGGVSGFINSAVVLVGVGFLLLLFLGRKR